MVITRDKINSSLSSSAQAALTTARELADSRQQSLAPAHLFMGLLDQGAVMPYLAQNGIEPNEARIYAEAALPEGPVDDRAFAKVLEFAFVEAWREASPLIQPHHLLIALVRQQKWSDLPPVLESLGLNLGQLREQSLAARRGEQKFATGHPLNQADKAAQAALDAAEAAMRATFCGRINTAHLLLGLLNTEPNGATAALERAGTDLGVLREAAQKIIQHDGEVAGTNRRFTPAAQRALDRARDLAERDGQKSWGPEQLLHALLPRPVSLKEAAREKLHYRGELDDPAAQVLEGIQPDFARVEAETSTAVIYTEGFQKAWAAAYLSAKSRQAEAVDLVHLVYGIAVNPDSLAFEALRHGKLDLKALQREVPADWAQQVRLANQQQEPWNIPPSPATNQALQRAFKLARAGKYAHTGVEHLAYVLLTMAGHEEHPGLQQLFTGCDFEAAREFLKPHVLRRPSTPARSQPPTPAQNQRQRIPWSVTSRWAFGISFTISAGNLLLLLQSQRLQSQPSPVFASVCYYVFFLQLAATIGASIFGLASKTPLRQQAGKAYLGGFLFGSIGGLVFVLLFVVFNLR